MVQEYIRCKPILFGDRSKNSITKTSVSRTFQGLKFITKIRKCKALQDFVENLNNIYRLLVNN